MYDSQWLINANHIHDLIPGNDEKVIKSPYAKNRKLNSDYFHKRSIYHVYGKQEVDYD